LLERPTSPVPGIPLSTPSTVRGLLPLSVTGLCAFFYPRPLRPVRASAPLRKATTARQPTAHTGARPFPPLPTGPPSSLSHLLSQRNARASTKQNTPGPQPRSRSLSLYRGATPMKPKGSMWSCPGREACQSRSWPCQETVTQVFIRALMSTGAPNKARGRSA
jgi:hypothetical protein